MLSSFVVSPTSPPVRSSSIMEVLPCCPLVLGAYGEGKPLCCNSALPALRLSTASAAIFHWNRYPSRPKPKAKPSVGWPPVHTSGGRAQGAPPGQPAHEKCAGLKDH